MARKIDVSTITLDEREAIVSLNEAISENGKVFPEGRMLVDSDHIAFVYILDTNEDYIYISFQQEIWDKVKTIIEKQLPVYINIDKSDRVHLHEFHEELQYLLSNIKENSNYGDKMLVAVNQVFGI